MAPWAEEYRGVVELRFRVSAVGLAPTCPGLYSTSSLERTYEYMYLAAIRSTNQAVEYWAFASLRIAMLLMEKRARLSEAYQSIGLGCRSLLFISEKGI